MAQTLLDREAPKRIEGVVPITGKQLAFQRYITVVMTVVPLAAVVWAVIALWGHGIKPTDFWIMLSFYLFTGLGVTVGLHRYFTHKAFKAVKPVRWLLGVAGSMAVQGELIAWVAAHRRHHAYADQEGDPHSPHLIEDGGAFLNLWHAHTGWLFVGEKTDKKRWAPDLVKDPMIARIDRMSPFYVVLSYALPPLIGLAVTGTFRGMWTAFIWGSLVRIFVLHHVTWSINSICHFYGRRPFEVDDESRNVWPLGWISLGESWHNNHHAFPSSAYLGLEWWQIDVGGYAIRALKWLGLARDVRSPTAEQRKANQLA